MYSCDVTYYGPAPAGCPDISVCHPIAFLPSTAPPPVH